MQNLNSRLPNFNPEYYQTYNNYMQSKEHMQYLQARDQIHDALNQNNLLKTQHLEKLDSQIRAVEKDRKIVVNPNMPMVYKDAPKWEYNPQFKDQVYQNMGYPQQNYPTQNQYDF